MNKTTRIRILLADDDKELCAELSGILEDLGYRVHSVHSAEDALKKLSESSFGVLLLDLKMRGLGGFVAFGRIKKLRPKLPVIIITAALSSEVAKYLPEIGATPVLYKPFGIRDIAAEIEKALKNRALKH